jgi:hypothetical protein
MVNKIRPRITQEEYKLILNAREKSGRQRHHKQTTEETTIPKILILDIETAPVQGYVWRLWKQNVYIDQVESDWFMLSWAAKWLFDSEIFSDVLTPEESLSEDDERISKSMWEFVDHADVIIGHNVDAFDMPKLNTRWLIHGINPPSPYRTVDTKKEAKKRFLFSSNKLDFIARVLGTPVKMDDGGFNTWKGCIHGEKDSLLLMEEYNREDINVTEEVYLKLRPWIKNHPNLGLYYNDDGIRCRVCGSENLTWEDGKCYATPLNKYSVVRCDECGAIGRARESAITKNKNKSLLGSCPV